MQHLDALIRDDIAIFAQPFGAHQECPPRPIGDEKAGRGQGGRVHHGPAEQQADRIVHRLADDIQIDLVLRPDRLDIIGDARQPERHRSDEEQLPQLVAQQQPEQQQGEIFRIDQRRRKRLMNRCALRLDRMKGVKVAIQPFVDHIIGRRDQDGARKPQ